MPFRCLRKAIRVYSLAGNSDFLKKGRDSKKD
jgi:hypothetical protein